MKNNTELLVRIIASIVVFFVLYYLAPFINGIYIGFLAKRKGKRIGSTRQGKISNYINLKVEAHKQDVDISTKNIDSINNMIKEFADIEFKRIEDKYQEKMAEVETKINSIESAKKNVLEKIGRQILFKEVVKKQKENISNSLFDAEYWKITFIIYLVLLITILDTMILGQWLQETNLYSKNDLLFSVGQISSVPFIDKINFPKSYLIGFLWNVGLLGFSHILMRRTHFPPFFKSFAFKITAIVVSILSVVVSRIILPNSDAFAKDFVLLSLWILLFFLSYLLLHSAMKKMDSSSKLISNFLFFLVFPISAIVILTGGFRDFIISLLQALVGAGYEIVRERQKQNKSNLKNKKENLMEGYYEGLTGEERG